MTSLSAFLLQMKVKLSSYCRRPVLIFSTCCNFINRLTIFRAIDYWKKSTEDIFINLNDFTFTNNSLGWVSIREAMHLLPRRLEYTTHVRPFLNSIFFWFLLLLFRLLSFSVKFSASGVAGSDIFSIFLRTPTCSGSTIAPA